MCYAFFGKMGGTKLFIDDKIVIIKLIDYLCIPIIFRNILLIWRGNYMRRAGLINKHGICLIYNCIVKTPLDKMNRRMRHIIPKVIEAKLGIDAISNICGVGICP